MVNYIGVMPWTKNITNRMKLYSLLFDKIAITNFSTSINPSFKKCIKHCDTQPELRWLMEKNILFEYNWWDSFKLESAKDLVNEIEFEQIQKMQGEMLLDYSYYKDTFNPIFMKS